ncbi:MAG: CocE/NonD family hydrolase [Ancalomicrobiaceae bacterium]|nr:CocE/NonD family hydrolase [Ancalomicrobiaceae bacterium]
MIPRIAIAFLAVALLPGPALAAETAQIPTPNGTMVTEIFKPAGNGPFPVVVFSHGRSGDPVERQRLTHPINAGVAAYWTGKGFAVVAPIRPGYGPSSGYDAEDHGRCGAGPDFGRTASAAATAIVAAANWARSQPWAKADRLILVGQSVGGLGTVAAAARNPPGVVAFVNFAGGTGGDPKASPGRSCRPDLMLSLYGQLGSSTSLPGMWFYAANDEYWGPDVPKQWAQAYRTGNPHVTAVFTGPVPNGKGHSLMNTAPQLWRPALDRFLKERGL